MHKPPTLGLQVAPLASELPLWRSENPRVVSIEDTISIHSHEGSNVTRCITNPRMEVGVHELMEG